jgi:hypothetical protein
LAVRGRPSLDDLTVISKRELVEGTFRLRSNSDAPAAAGAASNQALDADVTDGQLSISLRDFGFVAGKQHLYAVDSSPFLHLLDERP